MNKLPVLLAIVIILATCSKEEVTPRDYPRVNTLEVIDITSGGARFQGEITFASVPVVDHGFLWSAYSSALFENSDKISLGAKSGTGPFDAQCDRSLQEGKTYYMRSYAISANNTVYGDVVKFASLGSKAPVIKEFFPTLATWGDTVRIVGENFSTVISTNLVKFNEVSATIYRASEDTLHVKVPFDLAADLSSITITRTGNVSTTTKKFQLKAPIIESISPTAGIIGTEVTVTGRFLMSPNPKVYFNTIEALFVGKGSNFIKVKVPPTITGGLLELKVVTGTGTLFDTAPFETQDPEITEISPTIGSWGDVLTIKGKFFGSDPASNVVKFDDTYAQVLTASTTELTVEVPGAVDRSNPTINVNYLGLTGSINGFSYRPPEITSISPTRGSLSTEIIITGKYFNPYDTKVFLDDQPMNSVGVYSSTEIHAQYPGSVDKHSAKLKVVWRDQEATSEQEFNMPLIQLRDYSCDFLYHSISMVYNNKAYVGLGGYQTFTNQIWSFDPAIQQWNKLNDFPGGARQDAVSFVVGNKGYVGGGNVDAIDQFKDLWEYDFATDSWTQKSDLPISLRADAAFSIGNAAYLIQNNYETSTATLWKYNPALDTWTLKSIPGDAAYRNVYFVLNGALYILDNNNALRKFTPSTEQWTAAGYTPTYFNFVFSSNGSAFAGTSTSMYRFDPATNSWEGELSTGNLSPDMTITINDKGYMLGYAGYYKFCFEYDANY